MPLRHLKPAEARRVPWKNGRGVTEELALWPPGTSLQRGDFDWRIARAGVVEDGPFSEFAGFQRTLVIVSGEGLLLRHGAASPVSVHPLQPHLFSGDELTQAELLGGPVTDVNLLARRGRVKARASVLRVHGEHAEGLLGTHVFLHLLEGALSARAGEATPQTLAPGESLWLEDLGALELRLRGEGATALLFELFGGGD
jgi:environmental stress-induced protein Ves